MVTKIIPGKNLSYSIGQVSAHVDLPQSVLRYWETVFPSFNPAKSAGGSRQYSDADVALIIRIKELLYGNGFTIKGANLQLEKELLSNGNVRGNPIDTKEKEHPVNGTLKSPEELILKLKKLIKILED